MLHSRFPCFALVAWIGNLFPLGVVSPLLTSHLPIFLRPPQLASCDPTPSSILILKSIDPFRFDCYITAIGLLRQMEDLKKQQAQLEGMFVGSFPSSILLSWALLWSGFEDPELEMLVRR